MRSEGFSFNLAEVATPTLKFFWEHGRWHVYAADAGAGGAGVRIFSGNLFFLTGNFIPQQPERLGVLPIKLRGGLGHPPETWHQVPRGSEVKVPFMKR